MITDTYLINQTLKIEEHPDLSQQETDILSFSSTDSWIKESEERLIKNLKNLDINPV